MREGGRKETKLGPIRVPKLQSLELVFFVSPWSLYIELGLGFSVAKISQIFGEIDYLTNIFG